MSYTPNWISTGNTIFGASGAWQHQIMLDAGSGTFYVLVDQSAVIKLYVSTDNTVTWNLLSSACPITVLSEYVLFAQLKNGKIRITTASPQFGGVSATVNFTEYDIVGNAWTSIHNIGGGFTAYQNGPITAGQQAAGLFRFLRGDGSEIIIYQQQVVFTTPYNGISWEVHVLQLKAGIWTQIGSFIGDPSVDPYYILFSAGINPVTDVIDIFMNYATWNTPVGPPNQSDYVTTSMVHGSVAANNTVSARHLVEGPSLWEELMPASDPHYGMTSAQPIDSSENGRVAYSADGKKVAFGWGFWTNAYPNADNGNVGLHVAIGDLSITPLNPSWTVETVALATPKNWNNGFSNDVNLSFAASPAIYLEAFGDNDGSNKTWCGAGIHTRSHTDLVAYWGSRVNPAVNNTSKLYFSERTAPGVWTAPAILYPNPDRDTIHLDGFDVPSQFVAPATPLTIACPIANTGTVGMTFTASLADVTSGGTPPYTWAIISGSLPPGLTLNSSTGVISGTLTSAGVFHFTVQVTDSLGQTASVGAPCSITVSPPPPPFCIVNPVPSIGPTLVAYNEPLERQGS